MEVLAAVRRVKSEARVSPRDLVAHVTVAGTEATLNAVRAVEGDLRAAQNIAELTLVDSGATAVEVELA